MTALIRLLRHLERRHLEKRWLRAYAAWDGGLQALAPATENPQVDGMPPAARE